MLLSKRIPKTLGIEEKTGKRTKQQNITKKETLRKAEEIHILIC